MDSCDYTGHMPWLYCSQWNYLISLNPFIFFSSLSFWGRFACLSLSFFLLCKSKDLYTFRDPISAVSYQKPWLWSQTWAVYCTSARLLPVIVALGCKLAGKWGGMFGQGVYALICIRITWRVKCISLQTLSGDSDLVNVWCGPGTGN